MAVRRFRYMVAVCMVIIVFVNFYTEQSTNNFLKKTIGRFKDTTTQNKTHDWFNRRRNTTILTEVVPDNVFLFSAIANNYHTENAFEIERFRTEFKTVNDANYSSMTLIGWIRNDYVDTAFKCCYRLDDDMIIEIKVTTKNFRNIKAQIEAMEFVCGIPGTTQNIKYVSLVPIDEKCWTDLNYYLTPYFPDLTPNPGIAFCCKVAYGDLEASYLVEWLEIQRYIGVTKILIFTHQLKDDTIAVLQYYKNQGLVDSYPFDLPLKEEVRRTIVKKTSQAFTDASVTTFDCQERLRHYRYVSVTDTDEVIIANKEKDLKGSLPRALDKIWERKKLLQSITLRTRLHIIEKDTKAGKSMLTAKYTSCSRPVIDRPKSFIKPLLTAAGSVSTHQYRRLAGYRRVVADPEEIVLHHFRTARGSYTRDKIILDFNYSCPNVAKIAKLVEPNVQKVREKLSLFECFHQDTRRCICENCITLPTS